MIRCQLVEPRPRERRAEGLHSRIGRSGIDANPVALRDLLGPGGNGLLDGRNQRGGVIDANAQLEHLRDAADHPREVERVLVEMVVGVDQARYHRVALGVDHLGPVSRQGADFGVRADGENLVPTDCNGLGDGYFRRVVVVGGDYLAIDDDCLGVW